MSKMTAIKTENVSALFVARPAYFFDQPEELDVVK